MLDSPFCLSLLFFLLKLNRFDPFLSEDLDVTLSGLGMGGGVLAILGVLSNSSLELESRSLA